MKLGMLSLPFLFLVHFETKQQQQNYDFAAINREGNIYMRLSYFTRQKYVQAIVFSPQKSRRKKKEEKAFIFALHYVRVG